jgi:hypothetical protein
MGGTLSIEKTICQITRDGHEPRNDEFRATTIRGVARVLLKSIGSHVEADEIDDDKMRHRPQGAICKLVRTV